MWNGFLASLLLYLRQSHAGWLAVPRTLLGLVGADSTLTLPSLSPRPAPGALPPCCPWCKGGARFLRVTPGALGAVGGLGGAFHGSHRASASTKPSTTARGKPITVKTEGTKAWDNDFLLGSACCSVHFNQACFLRQHQLAPFVHLPPLSCQGQEVPIAKAEWNCV